MRELRTYTSLWNMEKRLYKFYDVNLPYPVSLKQIGFFIGTLIPWFFIMNLLNVPFSSPWYIFWVVPPVAAAYFGNKEVAEGKKLGDYVMSQAGFALGNKKYADFVAAEGDVALDETYELVCIVWAENPNREVKKGKGKKVEKEKGGSVSSGAGAGKRRIGRSVNVDAGGETATVQKGGSVKVQKKPVPS